MTYEILTNVVIPKKSYEPSNWKKNKVWYAGYELRLAAKAKGEMFYNREGPCRVGHMSPRYVSTDKCVACMKMSKLKYIQNTPAEKKRATKKRQHLKQLYDLTPEQYNEMLQTQNGVCKLCNKAEIAISYKNGLEKELAVDHCHETNKIRGLLCQKCNQAIGLLDHNPELLRKAALYCE